MPALGKSPYSLLEGEPIEIQVISENVAGFSRPTLNSDIILRFPPRELPVVEIVSSTTDSYTLNWSSTEENIVGYQLLYVKNDKP
jgi:hypothetical protein